MKSPVWTFTNKKSLSKSEFLKYIEKKVFKTIRQYNLMPENKTFTLKDSNDINTLVLKHILEKKFEVKTSPFPEFSSKNLSQISEEIFNNVINGNFTGPKPASPSKYPLYKITDEELELYAKLSNLNADPRKKDEKINSLFQKFKKKNPDLEINIIKALSQFPE